MKAYCNGEPGDPIRALLFTSTNARALQRAWNLAKYTDVSLGTICFVLYHYAPFLIFSSNKRDYCFSAEYWSLRSHLDILRLTEE